MQELEGQALFEKIFLLEFRGFSRFFGNNQDHCVKKRLNVLRFGK